MYDKVLHQGKMLPEWQEIFNNEYSLGELYRMAKDGTDFFRLQAEHAGSVTFED